MTQRKKLEQQIQSQFGVVAEHLWRIYPEYAVYRNPHGNKWFAIFMNVPARRLGMRGDAVMDILNLHISPAVAATVLDDDKFLPAYHMNKASWISIPLDGRLSVAQIMPLIGQSFSSVATVSRRRVNAKS